MGRIKVSRILTYLVAISATLFYGIPIFWIVISSFKPLQQALAGYGAVQIFFVFTPTLDAYFRIFEAGFHRNVVNSLIVATSSVGLSILIGAPAAYILSRVKTRLTKNIGVWIISTRMMPTFALALPFFVMFTAAKLVDTVFVLIIVYLTFNLSFVIWTLRGYFEEIPPEIERSARIDGCTKWQALIKVVLPISKPALVSVGIISYLLSWNEFLFAFILTSTNARTVTVQIANAVGLVVLDWPAMTAMSTITIVPALIFIAIAQKHIVKGLTIRVW